MGEATGFTEVMWRLLEELRPLIHCGAAGALGALANVALDERPVVLPRMEEGRLHLGFLGNLIVSVAMAYVVDHDFRTAFFAAVCGTTTLRTFKQRIEAAFEHERGELSKQDET